MIERIFNIPGLNVYITLLGIIIAIAINLSFAKKASRSKKIEIILMHAIGISAFMSIVNFIGHAFFADTLANSIVRSCRSQFRYRDHRISGLLEKRFLAALYNCKNLFYVDSRHNTHY